MRVFEYSLALTVLALKDPSTLSFSKIKQYDRTPSSYLKFTQVTGNILTPTVFRVLLSETDFTVEHDWQLNEITPQRMLWFE